MREENRQVTSAFWLAMLLTGALLYPIALGPCWYLIGRWDQTPVSRSVGKSTAAFTVYEFSKTLPKPLGSPFRKYWIWWLRLGPDDGRRAFYAREN
jgi:hypothetical protein